MRTSRALAVAAAALAPAGLVVVQAGPSSAEVHPCGAITMNPGCLPFHSPEAPPVSHPTFPYSSMTTTETVATTAVTPRVVQLPADGSCAGQLAAQCTTQAQPASASDPASAPAESPTLLHGLLPVASDRTVASPADVDHNNGLPMAPIAAAGTLLGGLGTLVWFRRSRRSN
jgi:hypothetical protein